MRALVRLGDALRPFGGEVLQGHYLSFGKPVACVGDAARCEKHGLTQIVEGAPGMRMDGLAVALDGHRCACGCQLTAILDLASTKVAP